MSARAISGAVSSAIAVEYRHRSPVDPARAGGDFVCAHYGADGSATIAVVDLAAKGIAALRQAVMVRRSFWQGIDRGVGPADIARLMNDALCAYGQTHRSWLTFGTAFVATCFPEGALAYVAAGTEPGIVFHGVRTHEHLRATSPMIGLERDWTSEEVRSGFEQDDTLVAYSDGITESRSPVAPGTFLGTAGLVSIVRGHAVRGRIPTCQTIMHAVEAWNFGWFLDDATLVVLKRC